MQEASAQALIANKKGLHARAAAKIVKAAANYDADVTIIHGANQAGAKSILGLLMLAAERGVEVELQAKGNQALEAINEIVNLINRRFDEED